MDNHSDLSDPSKSIPRQEPADDYHSGDFLTDHIRNVSKNEFSRAVIPRTRNIFFAIGALLLIRELGIAYAQHQLTPLIYVKAITEACLFIGLGFYTLKRPYSAILLGLVAFVAFSALSFIGDSQDGLRALVIRIVLMLLLAFNIPDARRVEKTTRNRP